MDSILGMLYGMAIGDALGMPAELWGKDKIQSYFGYIDQFLDGPKENSAACYFKKGQFTDDTAQALVIIDSLQQNDFIVSKQIIGRNLLAWAHTMQAFERNILGPSSKAALSLLQENKDPSAITSKALTNGAAMRIGPVGALFYSNQQEQLISQVHEITSVTHASDVAVGGAAMLAYAVCLALEDAPWDTIIEKSCALYEKAKTRGAATFSASPKERLLLAITYAKKYEKQEAVFMQKLYDVIGCGTLLSESLPTAIAIAYYAKDPNHCATICANIGGDTDTIGAMAGALSGAKYGFQSIHKDWITMIEQANDTNLFDYAKIIQAQRMKGAY